MSAIERDATVEIASAFADAVRVKARSVKVGDYVFGTTGQRDRVIRVSSRANNPKRVTITPENLWPLVCSPDDDITIVRGQR